MIKNVFGCGGIFSLLALGACSGSVRQSVGDGASGAGGSGNAQTHAGNAPTHAGGSDLSGATSRGRGGAAGAPGTCDPPCSEGYGCYELANDPAGFCAPLCDTQEQTSGADLSCANSVRGGTGTCVTSSAWGWLIQEEGDAGGDVPPELTTQKLTGLCSNACNPTLSDCTDGYTCDITSAYDPEPPLAFLYACLPNKVPHAVGDTCTTPYDGECGPGLTCSPRNEGIFEGVCTSFCDRRNANACPGGQTCTETVFTGQANDHNIGVCR